MEEQNNETRDKKVDDRKEELNQGNTNNKKKDRWRNKRKERSGEGPGGQETERNSRQGDRARQYSSDRGLIEAQSDILETQAYIIEEVQNILVEGGIILIMVQRDILVIEVIIEAQSDILVIEVIIAAQSDILIEKMQDILVEVGDFLEVTENILEKKEDILEMIEDIQEMKEEVHEEILLDTKPMDIQHEEGEVDIQDLNPMDTVEKEEVAENIPDINPTDTTGNQAEDKLTKVTAK